MQKHHKFFIRCIPPKATAQASATIMHRKDGSAFVGKPSGSPADRAKKDLVALMRVHVCPEPFQGPVALSVAFTWPWRKSEPKKNRAKGTKWIPSRPDADNLVKMMLDIMTTLEFWDDDGQVAWITVQKKWGDDPGIQVGIHELED